MATTYIQIKDKKIPIIIRNYRNSYNVKIFFTENILNVSKPARMSMNDVRKIIRENEEQIYTQYIYIMSDKNNGIKQWMTGDKILYKGKEYSIIRQLSEQNSIKISIDDNNQIFNISIPVTLQEEMVKANVDRAVKKLFKNNTLAILQERLPYWSKITKIKYQSVDVRDAATKFGSCVPIKRALHFNSRLIMLSPDKIDAVIVHELCHMIHANHSKDFYSLVKEYITNYEEIDKWLKDNTSLISI